MPALQKTRHKLRVTAHGSLRLSSYCDPVEETFHASALAPHQGEEFAGVEMGGFFAEECFEAPLNIGRGPGTEAVAFGDDPVVVEGVQHGETETSVRIGVGATRPR
jgi:hypothetical protein